MTKRVCRDCPTLIPAGTRSGRCPNCERSHDATRGRRQARGYDAEHDRERARWAPIVATGHVKCWRCGDYIAAGAAWDLGHDDRYRSKYRGPEHAACNRATAGGDRAYG